MSKVLTPAKQAKMDALDFKVFAMEGKLLGFKVDRKAFTVAGKEGNGPIQGSTATIESWGDLESRVTLTRVAAVGIFALALKKKKDNRTLVITIDHPDYGIVQEVSPKEETKARKWVMQYNSYASGKRAMA